MTGVAESAARDFWDAVEPMILEVRNEMRARQDKFEREVRASLAEKATQAAQLGMIHNFADGLVYWGNTLVTHRGGLWQALNNTAEEPGVGADWRLIANGLADISGFQDENDPRLLTLAYQMSSGSTVNLEARFPLPLHLGKFETGKTYEPGDEVAWTGSTWRAVRPTSGEPPSADWLLVAKAGERGRRGAEP
jgi:hypothetical protein